MLVVMLLLHCGGTWTEHVMEMCQDFVNHWTFDGTNVMVAEQYNNQPGAQTW